ncbi:MAG: lasso peptide biosynthesis PqqD family chaperone [Verrucomicrobiota bacterium]
MPTTRITANDSVHRREDLLTSSIDEDTVLLSLETNNFYGINEVGSRIWELLESPIAVTNLCRQLLDEFEVSEELCREHVLLFLNSLAKDGLVEAAA